VAGQAGGHRRDDRSSLAKEVSMSDISATAARTRLAALGVEVA
jgi:hypothetical protein